MKSYNYKNKKELPTFIINSKISEINNISSIFVNDSNYKDIKLQKSSDPINPNLALKNNHKKEKLLIQNITNVKNNINKKSQILFHSYKICPKNILLKKTNFKNKIKLRKFIYEKVKYKNKSFNKKFNINNNQNRNKNKSFNLSFSNISKNYNIKIGKSKEKKKYYNLKLINTNNFFNKNKIKLLKNPNKIKNNIKIKNKYDNLSKKDFYVHFNSLLDNIIRQKEKEIDKNLKTTPEKQLLENVYKNLNLYNRKIKKIRKFTPVLHEYFRDNTTSIEQKKNIPYFYNSYLNKNKNTFIKLNNTYSEIKKDIINDKIYNKKPKIKRRVVTVNYSKKEEINNEVREMKKDIGYEKPSIELFQEKSASFQFLTCLFDNLNNLNSNIAYQHRYYLGKKYGIDIKKDLLKIETEPEDYLYKFKKTIPK